MPSYGPVSFLPKRLIYFPKGMGHFHALHGPVSFLPKRLIYFPKSMGHFHALHGPVSFLWKPDPLWNKEERLPENFCRA